jgi:hypothetical protein
VRRLVAPERGVHVEGAAGDEQAVDPREVLGGQVGLVRQRDGQAAGGDHSLEVVLPQRVPGEPRPAAGRLGVEGEADQGTPSHAA